MSQWHLLLYVGAAILALRSFIQLVTNYRSAYEQQLVEEELKQLAADLERERAEEQVEHAEAEMSQHH